MTSRLKSLVRELQPIILDRPLIASDLTEDNLPLESALLQFGVFFCADMVKLSTAARNTFMGTTVSDGYLCYREEQLPLSRLFEQ